MLLPHKVRYKQGYLFLGCDILIGGCSLVVLVLLSDDLLAI